MKSMRVMRAEVQIPICSSNPNPNPNPGLCVKEVKVVVASWCGKDGDSKLATAMSGRERLVKPVMMGAMCVGIMGLAVVLSEEKALALGPEGPLVEEFWENVRRYGLYALTVSTGALYTIFRPIAELLKNPISAIIILALFGASIYILSQVLSAMVGVSDFSYNYGY
ncbi:hypothetical protein VNO78_22468 [Psophocarpus tetragonolobus]|uniref:Uncharacterized protein ycf33 n=1 Tax=Psophocarpus tetragonolobus TaxID=3891 RepID=A0AAN9S4X7_PSOTE